MNTAPFLLVGRDFEGDPREFGCQTLERAQWIARCCADPAGDGPPWQGWEIWWNNPAKDYAWEVHSTSDDGLPAVNRPHVVSVLQLPMHCGTWLHRVEAHKRKFGKRALVLPGGQQTLLAIATTP